MIVHATKPVHRTYLHAQRNGPLIGELPKTLETVEADRQPPIDDIQTEFTGKELMFAMDVPYVPQLETPVVLAKAANAIAPVQPDFVLHSCQETEHTRDGSISPFGSVSPAHMLSGYFASVGSSVEPKDIKVTMLSAPKHGKLNGYLYTPTSGYLGNDHATFMAEYKGKHYKMIVTIKVLVGVDENSPVCPPSKLIKVNSNAVSNAAGEIHMVSGVLHEHRHLGREEHA